jgi:hypothetical protein
MNLRNLLEDTQSIQTRRFQLSRYDDIIDLYRRCFQQSWQAELFY